MARFYHLAFPDRTGWFLGLRGAQVIPLAGGIVGAALTLSLVHSLPAACVAFLAGIAAAFIPIAGLAPLEVAPVAISWLLRRDDRKFEAPIPAGPALALPGAFGDCEVIDVPTDDGPVGVVIDRRYRTAAATIRLTTDAPFLLADTPDQERLLASFGDALAPLCHERNVLSLRWTSFAAPVGNAPDIQPGPAATAYNEVLDAIAGTTRHEVLCTLTVTSDHRQAEDDLMQALVEPLALLGARLRDAALEPMPLAADALGFALRRRLDPDGRGEPGRMATLAQSVGFAPLAAAGPASTEESLRHIRIDATFHRTYQVVEWPRSAVPAPWMADLLLALPPTRTICVLLEPLAPGVSRRAVGRQAAKLESDENQRLRGGFRVGADHEAMWAALIERERELVAGHPELEYTALVVLSAPDPAELDARERAAQSAAAAAGVELVPLTARHTEMLAVSLPLARTLHRSGR